MARDSLRRKISNRFEIATVELHPAGGGATSPRPEAENLHPAVISYEDMARVEISMNDATRMCIVQRFDDCDRNVRERTRVDGDVAQLLGERPSLHKFRDDEMFRSRTVRSIDPPDRRMMKRARSVGFRLDECETIRIRDDFGMEEFEDDRRAEGCLLCRPRHAELVGTKMLEEQILAECASRNKAAVRVGHVRSGRVAQL